MLLRDQPPTTFLIRFSSTQAGSFALAFRIDDTTSHILIDSNGPKGFSVQEQEAQGKRFFENLHQIVDYYSGLLQIPYNQDFVFEP